MSILTGIIGFIITLLMLRRKGGVGRHIGAFVLGMIVTLIPTIIWAGSLRSGWNPERVAAVWLIAIAVGLILQVLAMLVAMLLRRKASSKVAAA